MQKLKIVKINFIGIIVGLFFSQGAGAAEFEVAVRAHHGIEVAYIQLKPTLDALEKESIPLVGRLTALADVFDALTSERPYKKAWPVEKAVNLLKEESGQHFYPRLVELFLENLAEIVEISERYSEPGN